MTFLHVMYCVEYQETQEWRFITLIHLWWHSSWFRPEPFELPEVKGHVSASPSWTGVWPYRPWRTLCSRHMQFHTTVTTPRQVSPLFSETRPIITHLLSTSVLSQTNARKFTDWLHADRSMGFGRSRSCHFEIICLCVVVCLNTDQTIPTVFTTKSHIQLDSWHVVIIKKYYCINEVCISITPKQM